MLCTGRRKHGAYSRACSREPSEAEAEAELELGIMISLTVRNLTVMPLELKLVERFDRAPIPESGFLSRINSTIASLFHAGHKSVASFVPADGQEADERQDVTGMVAGAFETRRTNVLAPNSKTGEVLRLTFQTPGTAHRYVVNVPGPSPRSIVMKQLDGASVELTAVYVSTWGHLSIFSSAKLASWMGELHDDYPLSMLSIPGTHNSPTCFVALPSVRCQAVSISQQLENGVRFLDVRVSVNPSHDDMVLVHSVFPISLTGNKYFHDLLDELYAFLDANPSEVLLLSLKREGVGRGTDHHLSQHLVNRYCGGDLTRRWFTEPRIPTLRESRGKIVLIRRFNVHDSLKTEYGGKGWGIDASAWPDNCADGTVGSGLIRVQDFYDMDRNTNIGKKIELVTMHLEKACQRVLSMPTAEPTSSPCAGPLPLFVNFLSASNFFNASYWPEKIAGKVNPAVIEYLCIKHAEHAQGPAQLDIGDAGTGVIVTDWVGSNGNWDLIRCVVGWNARLQLKNQ